MAGQSSTGAAGSARARVGTRTAHAAVAAVADQLRGATDTAGAGRAARHTGPAGAAASAVAPQRTPGAAPSAGRGPRNARSARNTGAASATGAAVADQTGAAAVTSGLTGPARSAVAAIAVQQPARPAVVPGAGCPVGTVTDQRTAQQVLCGRVDQVERRLRERIGIGRFGGRIRSRTRRQRLHELLVEIADPRAQRLIVPGIRAEQ